MAFLEIVQHFRHSVGTKDMTRNKKMAVTLFHGVGVNGAVVLGLAR